MALAATSNGSFWIDECVTARFTHHTGFSEMWRDVFACKFSEVQMPLYITYVWAFEKIFGHGELALRLSALPFFVSGMTLLATAFMQRRGRVWPALVAVGLSPFVWYYLNEARPYAMQIGVTAMILAALLRLSAPPSGTDRSESRWLVLFLIGLVLLSGISMLGQLWAGAAVLAVFAVVPRTRWLGWWPAHRGKLLLTTSALLLLGFYYLWSLTVGARATTVGTTNLQTVLFIFYEQLGFVGPGPGRVELREAGVAALRPFAMGLAVYGGVVGLVFMAGLASLWQRHSRRIALASAACLAVPAGLILLAGVVTHFRVLGRHFAPLAVLLMLVLGLGLLHLWQRRGWSGRIVVFAFAMVTLISCLQSRFAARHEKDNYRQAAALARAALASGETVWWNADDMAARYYQVPIADATQPGVQVISTPRPGLATNFPSPNLVITSKPDVYDGQQVLAAYLQENGFQPATNFMAFKVWVRPGTPKQSR